MCQRRVIDNQFVMRQFAVHLRNVCRSIMPLNRPSASVTSAADVSDSIASLPFFLNTVTIRYNYTNNDAASARYA